MRILKQSSSIVLLLCALALSLFPSLVHADSSSELTITPVVIDEKAKARDILSESISITNTSDRTLTLYPSVNDVQPQDGTQPFSAAQNAQQASDSLSNWIELSRGVVELGPGEAKTIPFVIRVSPSAVPGMFHAVISFADGSTRDAAGANGPLAQADVNVDIQANVKELLQLSSFTTDNVVFSGDDVLFKYQLQNIGNQDLDPKGDILIYDRRGEEVASIDVNNEGKIVTPDQVTQLASVWAGASGFGQYKAVLDVTYGSSQTASVQDTVFFWVIPWKTLLAVTTAGLIAIIFFALYAHRILEQRHFGKLALAGLLKPEALEASPHIPSERAARIAATVEEKKRWFHRFKRQGFVPAEPPKAPASQRAAAAVPQQRASTPASGTIDLKQMWKQDVPATPTQHHVIDLKKQ